MKFLNKVILLCVLATASASIGVAQESVFGIKGGLNIATQSISFSSIGMNAPEQKFIMKPHVGVFYDWRVAEKVSLQPEVLFSAKGSRYEAPFSNGEIEDTYHYIAAPVLLKLHPTKNFSIHFGPQVGVLVGGTEVNDSQKSETTSPVDVSLDIGLDVMVSENVGFSGRYVLGLTDLDEKEEDVYIRNRTVQISTFITF